MTTAVQARIELLSRCSLPKSHYVRFTDTDVAVLKLMTESAFCHVARMSDVVFRARQSGLKLAQIRAAVRKLDRHEIISLCQDTRTGAECVELLNVKGLIQHKPAEDMQTLR